MTLEINGILNGVSALGVLLSSVIIGSYIFAKSRKLSAKLLGYAGAMVILIGLLWSGPSVDFLIILFTEVNIDPHWIYGVISYIWVAPAIVIAMNIGSELISPKKKGLILVITSIVGIIFEVGLILFPFDGQTFNYTIPDPLGTDIIDTSLNIRFFTFWALAAILVFVIIFNGFGSLKKAIDSTGIVRKKFSYLAAGFIIFPVAAVFDTLVPPGAFLPLVRSFVILTGILLYLGLKP